MKLPPRCPLNAPPLTDTGSITLCTTAGLNSRSNYPFAYHQGYHWDSPLRPFNAQNQKSPNICSARSHRYCLPDTYLRLFSSSFRFTSYAIAATNWSFREAGTFRLSTPKPCFASVRTHARTAVVSNSRNRFSIRTARASLNLSWSSNVPF